MCVVVPVVLAWLFCIDPTHFVAAKKIGVLQSKVECLKRGGEGGEEGRACDWSHYFTSELTPRLHRIYTRKLYTYHCTGMYTYVHVQCMYMSYTCMLTALCGLVWTLNMRKPASRSLANKPSHLFTSAALTTNSGSQKSGSGWAPQYLRACVGLCTYHLFSSLLFSSLLFSCLLLFSLLFSSLFLYCTTVSPKNNVHQKITNITVSLIAINLLI